MLRSASCMLVRSAVSSSAAAYCQAAPSVAVVAARSLSSFSSLRFLPRRCFSAAAAAPAKASMAAIKSLRDRTGAPITECKDALSGVLAAGSTDGSDAAVMDAAVEWLRKKGITTAAKKSGRVASEGLVALQVTPNAASIVEVNSETDFAARNDMFRALCASVSNAAVSLAKSAKPFSTGEVETSALQAANCMDPTVATPASVSVSTAITNVVSTLRENVQVRRVAGLAVQRGVIGSYVHNAVQIEEGKADPFPDVRMGRQACIVAIEVQGGSFDGSQGELQQIANKLAMQIVAATPRFVRRSDVPEDLINAEKAIVIEQASAAPIAVPGQPIKKAAKPKDETQMARMVEGKINKWLSEIVLLEQQFVVGGDDSAKPPTVQQVLDAEAKKLGADVTVTAFQRFLVGEGVVSNKGADSFAKEVAEKLAKAQ